MRLVAAAAVLGLASTTALAEPPGMTPPSPPPEPVIEGYRGQPAIADGVAVILAVTAVGAGNFQTTSTLGRTAYGTYVLGGPIIHLLRHRPGRAAISLAMRAGLPIGLGLLSGASGGKSSCAGNSGSTDCGPEWGSFVAFAGGFLVGALTASIVDSAVLAKGDDPPSRSVSPMVAPSRGGFTLGVAGAF
jgi:hypothetical protein